MIKFPGSCDVSGLVGSDALEIFKTIFVRHRLTFAEVIKYFCEEAPHFDEIKKKNVKVQRSAIDALQHTSDFAEQAASIRGEEDFARIKQLMGDLRYVDQNTVETTTYAGRHGKVSIREALKAVSRVKTKDGIFHIPLFDMDIDVSHEGGDLVEEAARALGISSGVILSSGKSYHLWGLDLYSEEEWKKLMYRALLLDRVDRRWIGHRLIDGQANLRISEKRGVVPMVARIF